MWTVERNVLVSVRFFSSLGYFGLSAILAVLLLEPPFHFVPAQIALLLVFFALADRGMMILWATIIHRLHFRRSLLVSSLGATVSLLALLFSQKFLFCVIMVIAYGLSLSLGFLSMRLWAIADEDEKERLVNISLFYRALNFAAGIAPVLAFTFPYQRYPLVIVFGSGLCQFVSFLIVFRFFHTSAKPTQQKFTFGMLLKTLREQLLGRLSIAGLYVILALLIIACDQISMTAFFYKMYYTIPVYMGFVLAINPFMIVVFQGKVSAFFLRLHHRHASFGFFVGLGCLVLGFVAMTLSPRNVGIWLLVFFETMGEMLIAPHIDFTISNKTPAAVHSYLIAFTGIVFAISRGFSQGGAVALLSSFARWGFPPQTWWAINALVFSGALALGIVFLRRRRTFSVASSSIESISPLAIANEP